MPRDSQSKLKKEQNKHAKKADEKQRNKKNNIDSDSDDGEYESSDEMDVHEYRKFLSKIFPSKNLNKKIKAGEKIKKVIEYEEESEEEEWETESEEEKEVVSKKKKKQTNKKKVVEESEDESEAEEESLGSEDSEYDSSEEEEKEIAVKGSNKLNIIFTIGGNEDEEEDEWLDEEDEEYVDSDDETEDEDATISSSEEEGDEKVNKKMNKKDKIEEPSENKQSDSEALNQLKLLLEKNPKDKSIKKCIEVYEKDLKTQKQKQEKREKKYKDRNLRIFRKIVRDKNTSNDFNFYEKLEIEEQKKILKELREINKITRIEKPYRMTLLESQIPVQFKAAAMKKINSLRYMEPGSGEFYKIKNWVDTFMRIPFGKHEGLPISIEDGVEKCHDFMENAQKTLDSAVYGLNDAKMQIMQMLGQLITNPKAIGTAIAIHGPPGTGKTSLVKEGISKILNRPFAFIALGGATDSSFLEGHGYTYEGSTWGKIVQILIDSKCMNPVIYFDELDKISDTPRGEEIAGILTHLTDTSQNSQFHDKYFAEINFDLSKCLFIFSYNDETKVNPILKDRMYRIKTKGYNQKEKTNISKNYLLPRICEQVRFNNSEIIIPEPTVHYIIDNHCNKEDGVRNLKRCLEIIHTKLNLYRLMKPGSNLFEQDMSLKVEFPFTVTKDIVDKLIKRENENISAFYSIYA
jgi:ATP-dependent Lon protease